MTIEDDYNLVGVSPLPFEDFLLRLLEFGATQRLARVNLLDRDGSVKTTVVEPGSTWSDISGRVAAAPETVQGVACWLRLVLGGVESPLVIAGSRDAVTLVEGPAYVPHIMREAEDKAAALEDMGRFAGQVAAALDCAYLGLSPEQAGLTLETEGALPLPVPEVFMIVSRTQMTGAAAPAFHTAAKVEPLDDRLLIWLQSPEAFAANRSAAPAAQHLARTLVASSLGSPRADR